MNYLLHLLIYFDIYAIVALSLNLVVGYCGLLTLAHAGYYALGGYTTALLMLVSGWGFLPALLAGAFLAGVASLAVSLPAWRLRGDFFVLASLAVQALIYSALYNWSSTEAPLGSWKILPTARLDSPAFLVPRCLAGQFPGPSAMPCLRRSWPDCAPSYCGG
ncbi:MAG: branched-chain amino acid ABC transporter permease [Gammaproteobacteria bacterium]